MDLNQRMRRRKIQHEAEGYLELGMPQYALQTLGRLGDPTGFDAQSLYLWGEGLRGMQRHVEALLPLERAAKLAPEDTKICLALGWCYKRTGRLDLAIDALEKALIREPAEAVLRYNLACYLSLAGHKNRALRHLTQAFSLEPAYCQMVDEESDFDSIRDDPEFRAVCEAAKQKGLGIGG
jgi:tetratricopeptide (TPR) repeat protein